MTCRAVLAIAVTMGLVPLGTTGAAAQASDFGFRFEVGDCGTLRLDTFNGVFEKHLGGERDRILTAHLVLTDVQMKSIYQTIESIHFFNYPSTFVGVPPDLRELTAMSPSNTYRLEVRNGGTVHTVSWRDGSKPTTAEADRLRDLFSMIIGFIHDHPAYKSLPPSIGGCE